MEIISTTDGQNSLSLKLRDLEHTEFKIAQNLTAINQFQLKNIIFKNKSNFKIFNVRFNNFNKVKPNNNNIWKANTKNLRA